MKNHTITNEELAEQLQASLEYRDGALYWKVRRKRIPFGSRWGHKTADGYRSGRFMGRYLREHRVVWLLHYGSWPDEDIDHANGIGDDNRIENLRACTPGENMQNRGVMTRNKSGITGVSWDKANGKWRAGIQAGGKERNLGRYDTKEGAHAAYCQAKAELHAFNPQQITRLSRINHQGAPSFGSTSGVTSSPVSPQVTSSPR